MRIAVTASGSTLDAAPSPVFGRCPIFLFVDTDTMQVEAVNNNAGASSGGAGIQAAQFVADRGAQAIVSGSFGPNAYNTLSAAGVEMYTLAGRTVREVVENFKAGRLNRVTAPSRGR
ncbi:MAG: NifB/NifX family molybdenum-iron cluster-binding protein [Anaerolineae bacterium]|nr:NifB/NifX family molybdenum-iron cluster-binding protein [Anaerolineae bacterium]